MIVVARKGASSDALPSQTYAVLEIHLTQEEATTFEETSMVPMLDASEAALKEHLVHRRRCSRKVHC